MFEGAAEVIQNCRTLRKFGIGFLIIRSPKLDTKYIHPPIFLGNPIFIHQRPHIM